MKMRNKRKQFWWIWSSKPVKRHFMGFFICHDFTLKPAIARIKYK